MDDLLPVKNDYVFSRLFGAKSHKRVLICLLNSILNGKPHINDITLDPNEYKKTSPDGKSIRLDIAATSDDGTIFNIEIQCKDEGNIVGLILLQRLTMARFLISRFNAKMKETLETEPRFISRSYEKAS